MKRIILCLLALVTILSVDAQIISSKSRSIKIQREKPTLLKPNFFIKAGPTVMFADAKDDIENQSKLGYNVSLGYQRPFLPSGVYWGAELGSTMAYYDGYDTDDNWYENNKAASIYFGPMIGLKKNIDEYTQIDTHLGGGFMHEFASGDDGDDSNRPFWELGVGVWYKRFLIELDYIGSAPYIMTNAIMLNLGFKF